METHPLLIIKRLPVEAKIGCCIGVWWSAAVVVTLKMKSILGSPSAPGSFPFPFALTAVTAGITAFFAFVIEIIAQDCCSAKSRIPRGISLAWGEAWQLVAVGAMRGMELGCINKSLECLTVSKRTMLFSMNMFFVMFIAVTFRLEHLTPMKAVAAVLICIGGLVQGFSSQLHAENEKSVERSVEFTGHVLAIAAMILGSSRDAFTQYLLQQSVGESRLAHMSAMQMIARIMPATSIVTLCLSLDYEPQAADLLDWPVIMSGTLVSVSAMLLIACELYIVQVTSAVCINVCSALHNVVLAIAGVLLFHDRVHALDVFGFSICLAGAAFYASARKHTHTDERRERKESILNETKSAVELTDVTNFDVSQTHLGLSGPRSTSEARCLQGPTVSVQRTSWSAIMHAHYSFGSKK